MAAHLPSPHSCHTRLRASVVPQHRRTQEILSAKNRHHQDQVHKDKLKNEQTELVDAHREELSRLREERRQAIVASKEEIAIERQVQVRLSKEQAARNADAIAHERAAGLNAAMYKRNEVRKVEAEARERKLREKELMIAHLQQRSEERQRDENDRVEHYDKQLQDLEREEYQLLISLEEHRVSTTPQPRRGEGDGGGRCRDHRLRATFRPWWTTTELLCPCAAILSRSESSRRSIKTSRTSWAKSGQRASNQAHPSQARRRSRKGVPRRELLLHDVCDKVLYASTGSPLSRVSPSLYRWRARDHISESTSLHCL